MAAARRRGTENPHFAWPVRVSFDSSSSEEWILHAAIHTPAFLKHFSRSALPLKYGIREFHHFLLSTNLSIILFSE